MRIRCPQCGTAIPLERTRVLCCGYCCARVEVSRAMLRRAERDLEAEQAREARMPLNVAGAIGLFAVTLIFLFGMYGRPWAGSLFSEASFWLFPAWTTALIAGAIALIRFDRRGEFELLRKSTGLVLVALLLPLVYQSVPRDIRTGDVQALTARSRALVTQLQQGDRMANR